ncbi:MAG: dihydropteroate synthase [Phycisphaerales bacterium]
MNWFASKYDRSFHVAGILNVTPDSFTEASRHMCVESAVEAARRMVMAGADSLDVGGESTRPGSEAVDADEQIRRVVPVIRAIAGLRLGVTEFGWNEPVRISIDTTSAAVAAAALDAGATCINDISAGRDDERMCALAAERRCAMILMHREKPPREDRFSDQYSVRTFGTRATSDMGSTADAPISGSVVAHVKRFLDERTRVAMAAGVSRECIAIDPGLGFGKTVEQNLELIRATREFAQLGFPVMSALSRKSFVGRMALGRDSQPSERLAGTIAMSVMHYLAGARIFRVHDVAECVEALRAVESIEK